VEGNFLISNFNNSTPPPGGSQGEGSTIVQISPGGKFSLFAQIDAGNARKCPGGVGLTTALVVLRKGWVIVGSLPTPDGTSATATHPGCLFVLNKWGKVVHTITGHHINGPWDMTAVDGGRLAALFFTNVLNGTLAGNGSTVNEGTVVRMLLEASDDKIEVLQSTVVGSGFPERTDPAALVIGPTGLAFDSRHGILYVADSLNNRIAAIPNALFRFTSAGIGKTISVNGFLNDPLGLALAPNGNILAANGNDGNIVEIEPDGDQVSEKLVDSTGGPPPGGGTLFGLAVVDNVGLYFVDDGSNTLNLLSK
jgi:DNA-binding beta-propeller fold protein YncE